jgi:predicted nucleotidyltransferase
MRINEISQIRRAIRDLPVVTLYLFGSRARNQAGPISDYDFAVQTRAGLSSRERFKLKLVLLDRFTRALKSDHVDVVVLEEAPPLLAHRVLKDGKILFCRNARQRVRSEFRHLSAYLDFREDLDLYTQAAFGLRAGGAAHG